MCKWRYHGNRQTLSLCASPLTRTTRHAFPSPSRQVVSLRRQIQEYLLTSHHAVALLGAGRAVSIAGSALNSIQGYGWSSGGGDSKAKHKAGKKKKQGGAVPAAVTGLVLEYDQTSVAEGGAGTTGPLVALVLCPPGFVKRADSAPGASSAKAAAGAGLGMRRRKQDDDDGWGALRRTGGGGGSGGGGRTKDGRGAAYAPGWCGTVSAVTVAIVRYARGPQALWQGTQLCSRGIVARCALEDIQVVSGERPKIQASRMLAKGEQSAMMKAVAALQVTPATTSNTRHHRITRLTTAITHMGVQRRPWRSKSLSTGRWWTRALMPRQPSWTWRRHTAACCSCARLVWPQRGND